MLGHVFICQWCAGSQDKATQLIHALKHVFRQMTQAVTPNNPSQIHQPGQALLTASQSLIMVGLSFTVSWHLCIQKCLGSLGHFKAVASSNILLPVRDGNSGVEVIATIDTNEQDCQAGFGGRFKAVQGTEWSGCCSEQPQVPPVLTATTASTSEPLTQKAREKGASYLWSERMKTH